MIRYLAGAGAGLSLLSVSTSSLPASIIQSLMTDSAAPNDILGTLVDGSIGALTLRPRGDGGEEAVEQRFIDRLLPLMTELSERRIGGRITLWLRAVHRPAAEIAHAPDLIGCLFDVASTPLTISADSDALSLINRNTLFPRVTGVLMPFIEPAERQPPLLRLLGNTAWPARFD
jgi:hypothetical protein